MGIEAQLDAATLRIVTSEVQVSRDMGLGAMQAQMQVTPHESAAHCYRLDVKRKSGDTFQFHAFYRQLRESLAWLNGWTGSSYRTSEPTAAAGAPDAGGAAGWGRRL